MKISWIAVAAVVTALCALSADAAFARSKHHSKHYAAQRHCVPNPAPISIADWLFSVRPKPQWNGCSPPVYVSGEFIGQDPDIHVRHQLRRDPEQGYRMQK